MTLKPISTFGNQKNGSAACEYLLGNQNKRMAENMGGALGGLKEIAESSKLINLGTDHIITQAILRIGKYPSQIASTVE